MGIRWESEQEMEWQERVIRDPDILAGKPHIKGTRISVEFVLNVLSRGWSVEQVLPEYDHLTIQDIKSCLAVAKSVIEGEL